MRGAAREEGSRRQNCSNIGTGKMVLFIWGQTVGLEAGSLELGCHGGCVGGSGATPVLRATELTESPVPQRRPPCGQPRGLVPLSPRGAWLALSKKGMPGQPVDGQRAGGQPSLLSVRTPSVRPISWLDTPRLCVVTAWFCVRTDGSQKHSLPGHRPLLPLDSRPGRGDSGTWGPFSPSRRGPRRRHLGKAQCRQSHTCWGLLQLRILPPTVRSLSLSARARALFWIPSGFHSFKEGEPQSCSILFVWVYPTA